VADGIVVVDVVDKVRFVNPAAERLLGRGSGELVGQAFGFPLLLGETTEVEIHGSDGGYVVVELRVAESEWEGRDALVVSLRDVTERAKLIEQQDHMIDRLRELDEMKTDFVSMVSHDLRSPMASIAGFADTLRFNWDAFDDEQKVQILERISRNTNQLARFVENILQVTQIESGALDYDIRIVDLKELVERVVDENTRVSPTGEPATIEVDLPDELPSVRADEIRQWQILTNLVTNALKFSPPEQAVRIRAGVDGTHVIVSVQDSGLGIRKEDMGRLFEKFSRLEQPRGQKVKGTGLGLYICKAMIEGQGGEVWVESEPGQGATFSYTVPVAD